MAALALKSQGLPNLTKAQPVYTPDENKHSTSTFYEQ